MDPGPGLSRSGSNPSNRSLEDSRGFVQLKVEPDIEEAITRWGSHRSASQAGRGGRQSLGKFGSERSVSILDTVAAGGKLDMIPYYDISIMNLSYEVQYKTKEKGTQQRLLLNHVSAEAHHGQILAVVGPSGSGKTTFLDALAGRVAHSSLQGEIYVNGLAIDDSFKRISGYVMQDDANFPMLTVRETLLYSARLRLPGSMSLSEKTVRVDNMIKQLGLTACAETRVGNDQVRGVSGGERRRVSIGADLIHDPAVLFLDEPTSGLDSTSALNVMQNLNQMAQSGRRTVVLTIHQPSYRMLETIDNVLVLGKGHVVYHGPHAKLKHYFDPLGRCMPEFVNVIEYALDTIEDYQRTPEGLEPLIKLQAATKKKTDQQEATDAAAAAGGGRGGDDGNDAQSGEYAPEYATSFVSECAVLSSRNFKNTMRTPELFLSRAAMMVMVSTTVGTLFLRADISQKGVQQRTSFIAFALACLIFTSNEALGIFIEERQIFIRETSRGAYRASSYVIAGAMTTVPLLLILAILFTSCGYFVVGFVNDTAAFFFFVLIVWLTLCMANSFVIFISALVPNFSVGSSVCAASIAYFLLLSGFFIQRTSIPKYWIWLHYISIFKYPYESLLDNEFGNKHFNNRVWYGSVTSDDILRSLGVGKVHQWVNVIAIVIIFLGYRFFFWIVLRYFTKSIRK